MKFQTHVKNNSVPVAFVDIDDTICFYPLNKERIYEYAVPDKKNIQKINKLFNSGWKIVYFTSRGSTQIYNKKRMRYLRRLTKRQLCSWGAKFHELKMGDKKPLFDLIIDDKAKRIEEL